MPPYKKLMGVVSSEIDHSDVHYPFCLNFWLIKLKIILVLTKKRVSIIQVVDSLAQNLIIFIWGFILVIYETRNGFLQHFLIFYTIKSYQSSLYTTRLLDFTIVRQNNTSHLIQLIYRCFNISSQLIRPTSKSDDLHTICKPTHIAD